MGECPAVCFFNESLFHQLKTELEDKPLVAFRMKIAAGKKRPRGIKHTVICPADCVVVVTAFEQVFCSGQRFCSQRKIPVRQP